MFLAGQLGNVFQVWSVDVSNGQRRLEISRPAVGESEGLATFSALGGVLHWMIVPYRSEGVLLNGRSPSRRGRLVHLVPAGTFPIEVSVTPRGGRAGGAMRRFTVRARVPINGETWPVAQATVRFAGQTVVTGNDGKATIVARLPRSGSHRVRATKKGLLRGSAAVRVSGRR